MAPSRRLVRWAIFPAVLFGALGAAWGLREAGVSETLVVLCTSTVAGVVILALQRLLPARTDWRWWRGDAGLDLLHLVFSSGGGSAVARGLFSAALFAAAAWLSATVGTSLWPAGWPVALQLALALVVADLPAYWWHRASHAWGPLWRLHALHHSSERLYLLSSGRTHPLHVVGTWLAQLGTLALLGAPSEVLLLVSVFTPVHGFLQHANIDLLSWPFHWVFATCDLHRWHHSTVHAEERSNFGNNLILWDIVFGTRFLPTDRATPAQVGLADMPDFPRDYRGQLASPFSPRLWRVR